MLCSSSRRLSFECVFRGKLNSSCNIFKSSPALSTDLCVIMRKCRLETKVEKRFVHYQAYPLKRKYQPRLSDTYLPAPMWNIFYRQNEAFDYARGREDAKVFAVESPEEPKCGPRSYVVASLEEFWTNYKQLPSGKRHFYEVIPSDSHCHLYFDLEFDKSLNPKINGQKLVDIWIEFVSFCLEHEFNINTCRNHVLELDSTTEKKFSQHLIWHIPNTLFKSNFDVGIFVHNICSNLVSYLSSNNQNSKNDHWIHSMRLADRLDALLINSLSGEKALFVDEGVYTKNRNFRLYLSSKKGKVAELKLSSKCCFGFFPIDLADSCCFHHTSISTTKTDLCSDKEKLIFFSSLITNVYCHSGTKVLEFASSDVHETKTSVVHVTNSRKRTELDPAKTNLPVGLSSECFAELLDFVTNYVQKFNKEAYVSKVKYEEDTCTLFFDVLGTRYCHIVGREHKSNGIFIVVQLRQKLCYHRCYDYDCRKSLTKPSPIHLPKSIEENLPGYGLFSDVSDSELLQVAEEMERT